MVKRILRKYKYPPDDPKTGEYTESVTKVLDQAERLADFWTQDERPFTVHHHFPKPFLISN